MRSVAFTGGMYDGPGVASSHQALRKGRASARGHNSGELPERLEPFVAVLATRQEMSEVGSFSVKALSARKARRVSAQ